MIDVVPIYSTVAWLRCYLNNSTLLSPMYLTVASWSEGECQTVGKAFFNILIPRFHLKAMSAQETQANTAFAWNILKYTVSKERVEKFHKEVFHSKLTLYLQLTLWLRISSVADEILMWDSPTSVLDCTTKKTNPSQGWKLLQMTLQEWLAEQPYMSGFLRLLY